MIKKMIKLLFCHLLGDYVLQTQFLADTKGECWYHMFVHCGLYVLPFSLVFGINLKLLELFFSHIIIDSLKVRWKKIDYVQDQFWHYVALFIYLRR